MVVSYNAKPAVVVEISYREMGAMAVFQAVMYFFGFLGLRALARKREAEGSQTSEPKSS